MKTYNSKLMQRAMVRMTGQHVFYATIAMNMRIVEKSGDELRRMSGGLTHAMATDGVHIFVNPEWFEKLPLQQAVSVLVHEVEHVARLHPFRRGARDPAQWNWAADAVINQSIKTSGGQLPEGCVDGSPYAGQTEEQIYAARAQQRSSQKSAKGKGNGGQDGQDGQDGQEGQDDPHGHPHDAVLKAPDTSKAAEHATKQLIAKAAQVAKMKGCLPAHMRGEIDELLNPTVDWREPLRRFLTEIAYTDYSWQRINRRYVASGIYLPGLSGEGAMRKLGVVIDTSGSIGMRELTFYFSELCGAIEEASPGKLVVAYCDAEVQHADVFDSPDVAQVSATKKRHGGGGTSMPAGLAWFEEHHPDVTAVIVLTDMYTDFGTEPPFPVLWATETVGRVAPYGETLVISMND